MLVKTQLQSVSSIFILLLLILATTACYAHLTEIIFDDNNDGPSRLHNNNNVELDPFDTQTCQIEFQVMKKYVGHCAQIGKNMRGCVAGSFIHPYHPVCVL
jgi:hypothetical protein